MDVLPFGIANGFGCPKCGFALENETGDDEGGHEQSTKLNAQFKFITELLPKIDAEIVPENNFEQAFSSALKVERDATNPAYESAPVDTTENRPTAVRGMTNTGPTNIVVNITSGEGPTEADKAAEQAKKQKNAAQNALPQHFTHSTITGEQVKFGQPPLLQASESLEVDSKKGVDTPSANGDEAGIDDYFAQLKAAAAREAEQELDEEEETDDDDDEDEGMDFEDVPTGSGAATPAMSNGGGIKDEDDEGRVMKKIKIEPEHEESDEDIEFEDV
jgi:transcription initiation factor TFIIE subunit alpha